MTPSPRRCTSSANTAMVFVPPRFAADAILESADAGVETIVCITEGIPAHDMLRVYNHVRPRGVTLLGPELPGGALAGVANVGIIPAQVFAPGRIGLVSRSGTLTYQIGKELADAGLGNSSIVGIGGDPVVGQSFIDVLARFEADPETDLVVMVGEIGGSDEEQAADYIAEHMSTPVVAYIAGFQAPPGKTMGHAGRSSPDRRAPPQAKKEALEARGVRVGAQPHRDRPGWPPGHYESCRAMAAISFTRGVPSADLLPVDDIWRAPPEALERDPPARSPTRRAGTCRCASGSASGTACRPAGADGQRLAAGPGIPGRSLLPRPAGHDRARGPDLRPHADHLPARLGAEVRAVRCVTTGWMPSSSGRRWPSGRPSPT